MPRPGPGPGRLVLGAGPMRGRRRWWVGPEVADAVTCEAAQCQDAMSGRCICRRRPHPRRQTRLIGPFAPAPAASSPPRDRLSPTTPRSRSRHACCACPQVVGKLCRGDTVIDTCHGNWLHYFEWDKGANGGRAKRLWDIRTASVTPAVAVADPLPSDCRNREDVVFLKAKDQVGRGGSWRGEGAAGGEEAGRRGEAGGPSGSSRQGRRLRLVDSKRNGYEMSGGQRDGKSYCMSGADARVQPPGA